MGDMLMSGKTTTRIPCKKLNEKAFCPPAAVNMQQEAICLYQYRYMNTQGKRITVYAPTLNELRQKEDDIQAKLRIGIDYDKGTITVGGLIQQYLSGKQGVRPQSMQAYQYFAQMISKYPINSKQISKVKTSDAKKWMIDLHANGIAFNTIKHIHSLCKSAFAMAYEEDVIVKNPFSFKVDMVPNDTKARQSLSLKQQEDLRHFLLSSHDTSISMTFILFYWELESGLVNYVA